MKVIPVAVFLLLLQPVSGQYNWAELDAKLKNNQQLLGNNVVTLIWKDDSVVYKKELGKFSSATQAPIASCSKWLTAAVVMIYVDEGVIKLDDKVSKYIPSFNTDSKKNITIQNCLSHMTGISDDGKFLKRILERRKFASLEEEVNDFAKKEQRAEPGTDFWYGNVGLNTAGRVLEVITGKKFEYIVKEKLFVPLGMNNSTFAGNDKSPVNPSGGATSTADDYLKFLIMLLNDGKYKGKRILSEGAVSMMKIVQDKPEQIASAPKSAEGYCYASGCWVIETKSNKVLVELDKSLDKKTVVPGPANGEYKTIVTSTALASPGLFGTWPMIDYCRGYAYIVFVKNLLGDERADVHRELKKIIDQQLPSSCN